MNLRNKKSISPLIATILLIVVSVILITVVLTWGSSFAKGNLNRSNQFSENTKSDLSSFVAVTAVQQLSENNVITIRNLHSKEPITFIGYKLITKENYVFANQKLYFDEVITLEPGAITSLNLICFPENNFTLQLFDQDQTHFTLPIKINNYRSNTYCVGKDGAVAAYDMKTIVEDTLIDLTGNGYDARLIGQIVRLDDGLQIQTEGDRGSLLSTINLVGPLTITTRVKFYQNVGYIVGNSSTIVYSCQKTNSTTMTVFNQPVALSQSILNNVYYTLTLTRDQNNNLKVYLNGVDITSGTVTRSGTMLINRLFCSKNVSPTWILNGEIRDLRIYDLVLSNQEIKDYHSIMSNPLE
ncbi:MAG: hypothetical protein PHU32_04260 [Candidatus ainarchaeum sp.]|nr:hypothetical protein [Candidatus ainarchaeum sp.]